MCISSFIDNTLHKFVEVANVFLLLLFFMFEAS